MKSMRILGAGLAAAIALGGCVTVGHPFDEAQISRFQVGHTTEADVVAALGPPMATASSPAVHVMTYSYTRAQARAETFIPIIGPLVGGADATSKSISFVFTPDGVLQSASRSGSNVRTGAI